MYPLSKNLSACRNRKLALFFAVLTAPLLVSVTARGQNGHIGPDEASGLFWGTISYYAGGGTQQFSNGVAATDLMSLQSYAVAADSQGNVYLQTGGQGGGNSIYMVYAGGAKIPPMLSAVTSSPVAGAIYQVAGADVQCTGVAPALCQDASTALQATFGYIAGMAFDANDNLYVADEDATAVRRIDYASTAVTTVAGQLNNPTPFGSTDVGDGGPATSATLFFESDVKVDTAGNLFIADGNNEVRVVYGGVVIPPILAAEGISPQKGYIYRAAGTTGQFCSGPGMCGANSSALSASFGYVIGVTVDGSGNVYVADYGAQTIDLVYAGGDLPPLLKTATATPSPGSLYEVVGQEFVPCTVAPCGDGGPALQAQLNAPYHLHVDQGGNLYFQDQSDYTVRKVDAAGYISVSAGTESPNSPASVSTGNGGPATSAQFQAVSDFAIDAQNALYVLDQQYVWRATAAAAQSISFPSLAPVAYGDPPVALNAVAENSQGTPTGLPITYAASGPGTISGSDLLITGAGLIEITATQAGSAQYAPASATQALTVKKATLTVTANDASKVYGAPNPIFTTTFTGFVNGDTRQNAVTGQPAFSTTATTNSDVGTYPIMVSQGTLAATNYNFIFVPGTLTISGATQQTISFSPLPSITYGQSSTIALAATASSHLPVQYTVNSGPGSIAGSTLTITGGGDIAITASQPGNDMYAAAAPVTQTLAVHPAPLTVIGPVFSLPYGTSINPATFPAPTITGFVGNDSQALVTGSPQYATTATGTPQAGASFPVQVAQGSLALAAGAASNYTFAIFVPGTLSIVPASDTIVFDQLTNSAYGSYVTVHAVATDALGKLIGLPVTVTATSPGIFADYHSNSVVLTTAVPTANLSSTAAGTVTVTATQPGTIDYAAAQPVSQTIAFAEAPLNVTATSFTREYGAGNPPLTFQLGCPNGVAPSGCFVNNDSDIPSVVTGAPNLSTAADTSSPPGAYPIVITQGTLAAPNYSFNLVNGTLTVLPAGSYTITADPNALAIPAGQVRQTTLTITPVNLYQGTITVSCGQLPANVSCVFSPATYTFTGANNVSGGANPSIGTLTVNTLGGQQVVGVLTSGKPEVFTSGINLLPGGIAALLIALHRRRAVKHRAGRPFLLLLALGVGALGLGSCGGGSSMSLVAAPGSYTLIINGTGTTPSGTGTVSQSSSLAVTVQ